MTGRNAPCPCKSGKKWKFCHGKSAIREIPRQTIHGPAIVCLMPTRGKVTIETVQSLSRNDGMAITMRTVARKGIVEARNSLWNMAKETISSPTVHPLGGWFVLWVDDDAFWRPGTIATAIDTLQRNSQIDLLAGWFGPRAPQSAPTVRFQDESWPRPSKDCEFGDVIEVYRTGFHFVLHRSDLINELPEKPFTLVREDGEDTAFCARMREAGKRMFVHTGLDVAHIGDNGLAYLPGQPEMQVVNGQLQPVEQPITRSYGPEMDQMLHLNAR